MKRHGQILSEKTVLLTSLLRLQQYLVERRSRIVACFKDSAAY